MDAPDADIPVDEALVRELLAEQHPDLSGELRLVANGWDNAVYRLGEELAVRIPRRRVAAVLIEHEQRWLPTIARNLASAQNSALASAQDSAQNSAASAAVPQPVRVGVPSPAFPHPWSVVPWFSGRSAATVEPAGRTPAAEALAEFVHAMAVPAPQDAPVNPFRGVPLAARADDVRERIERRDLDPRLLRIFDDALAAPVWAGDPLWIHGDLHPGNLILSENGCLNAVIDFGDLGRGDPATDLATAWLSFDAEGGRAFRRRIGELREADDATWQRARGWALVLGSAIVDAVHGDGPIRRVGEHTLRRVLEDQGAGVRSAGASWRNSAAVARSMFTSTESNISGPE